MEAYKQQVAAKEAAKIARKASQAANVEKKKEVAASKTKRRNKYTDKLREEEDGEDSEEEDDDDVDPNNRPTEDEIDSDDDDQYYRDEVGEDAEAGTFSKRKPQKEDPTRKDHHLVRYAKDKKRKEREAAGETFGTTRHPFAGPPPKKKKHVQGAVKAKDERYHRKKEGQSRGGKI